MTERIDSGKAAAEHPPRSSEGGLDRRSFLQRGGLAAAGLALAPHVAQGWASRQTASEANAALPRNVPKYIPGSPPPPDVKGSDLVPPGYYTVPEHQTQAYPAGETPAHGGSITLTGPLYAPPPANPSSNRWWQALEKAIGAKLTTNLVPSSSYTEKQAAAIASGNLGDMMDFLAPTPNFLQLLQSKYENLTPYLSGNNIKNYPNLAAIPTQCWENTMINGEIWGIPVPRPLGSPANYYRGDVLKKLGAKVPTSGDEFTQLCKELTGGQQWAISPGHSGGGEWVWSFFFQMFGLPNNWQVKNGKFTHFVELPETPEALNYMVKLQKAGYYYPGGPVPSVSQEEQLFAAGKIWTFSNGISGSWNNIYNITTVVTPDATLGGLVPPPYSGKKAEQVYWNSAALSGLFCGITKASKSRIKELLRVCDWVASPFGSKEYMLLNYGVEGHDYTLADGAVTTNSTYTSEDAFYAVTACAGPPWVVYSPSRVVVQEMCDFVKAAAPVGINDPEYGLYSPTNSAKSSSLSTIYVNAISDIVAGRQPVSSWSDVVSQWRSQGGSQIAKELASSYAKAKKA